MINIEYELINAMFNILFVLIQIIFYITMIFIIMLQLIVRKNLVQIKKGKNSLFCGKK